MNQLSDPKMLAFILKQMENQLPYFGPFAKLSKNLLKKMLDLWGSATETVRILAFINIRRMALDFPYPFIGSCLKGVYLTYVRNAKFTNPKTLPLINFMSNCVTEIYGLDWNLSYQHMFVYVRQLAIILRTSFNTKSKDSYDTVYNWQFINSIRAFVRIFSAYPNQPVLQLLIHPLMQIIQGVISLVPTPRYFPLRFQCVRMMNEVAMFNTGTYINGLPFLLEVCRTISMVV
jgi:nucleolar complex protein 2